MLLVNRNLEAFIMRDKYVFIRPYCGGTEVIGAYQSSVTAVDNIWGERAMFMVSECM